MSKEPNQGKDIHAHTASLIFSKDESAITPAERRIGKTINFGVIYGMSTKKFQSTQRKKK